MVTSGSPPQAGPGLPEGICKANREVGSFVILHNQTNPRVFALKKDIVRSRAHSRTHYDYQDKMGIRGKMYLVRVSTCTVGLVNVNGGLCKAKGAWMVCLKDFEACNNVTR